jgi:hypothetical protein
MQYQRLIGLMAMAWCLAACSAPLQEQSYLQEYGGRGGRGQGFRMQPYYVVREAHVCVPGKINGTITRLRVETFSLDLEPGLALDVQTPDQGLAHVHLGPLWVLDRHMPGLKKGDEVTLQTLCYNLAGQERLVASEITHNGNRLVLQDPNGIPFWEAWRKK